jgi:hypothetical protein
VLPIFAATMTRHAAIARVSPVGADTPEQITSAMAIVNRGGRLANTSATQEAFAGGEPVKSPSRLYPTDLNDLL